MDGGNIGDDIKQLTRLQSEPHKLLSRKLPGRPTLPNSLVKMLARREANFSGRSRFSSADSCHVSSQYLPENGPHVIDELDVPCYVAQFSRDGSLFVAGFEESRIKIYDVDSGWSVRNYIRARGYLKTIADTSLSPDKRLLVYSNLSQIVHVDYVGSAATESVANMTELRECLNFYAGDVTDDGPFFIGILSVKFSNDGRELVAASTDASVYVYDLGAERVSIDFPADGAYVMTACFADESGQIIYSGGSDALCKVWDKRCLVNNGKASGVLVGHLDDIAFINSRGDGRHLISNSSDQTIKLWDIRKMFTDLTINPHESSSSWEWSHPNDISVATYSGHQVFKTPMRCYFSPARSTGQKYIYTGSSDGSVYIYDLLSEALVAKLKHGKGIVSDCGWHPYFPTLISSSIGGVITKWDSSDDSLNQET